MEMRRLTGLPKTLWDLVDWPSILKDKGKNGEVRL